MIVVWVEEEGRLVRDERGRRALVGCKPIELLDIDGGVGERRRRWHRSGCRYRCESEYEQRRGVATGRGCVDPGSVAGRGAGAGTAPDVNGAGDRIREAAASGVDSGERVEAARMLACLSVCQCCQKVFLCGLEGLETMVLIWLSLSSFALSSFGSF